MDCPDVTKIATCYTTTLTCNNCMKSLLNTSCKKIVYIHENGQDQYILEQWSKAGREVVRIDEKAIFQR